MKNDKGIPVYEKACLTIEEAAAYSNIGENKLRELCNERDCEWVLFVGNRRLIKRIPFEKWLYSQYSI